MQGSQTRRTAIRTSKNAVMLLVGTMARMVAGFAFVLYCADQLGVEGFGQYSIAIHYFELFLSLSATAVGILLTRDIARWPKHTAQLMTSAIVIAIVSCSLAPVCMFGLSRLFNYSSDTSNAMLLASCALLPAALCSVFEAALVAKERSEFVTIGTVVESILRIGLSFLALYLGWGLLGLMWVLLVARVVLLAGYIVGLRKLSGLRWAFSWRQSRRFALRWRVFAAENWMATIYTSLDIIVLSWISGEVAAGLYSAAWKVVRLGTIFAKSYTTAIFPVMSRMHAESKASFARLYRHTIRVMCTISLPAIAVVTVVPDRVIGMLFSEDYSGAVPVLQVLIWVLLIEFINPFLSHTLFAQGKQHRSMQVAGISLVVNSIATYLLVTKFGAVGAALGTVLGGVVAMLCYFAFAMPRSEWFATASVVSRVLLASALLAVVVHFARQLDWIPLATVCLAVYTPLLFLVGAIRTEDLRFFRTTFLMKAAT